MRVVLAQGIFQALKAKFVLLAKGYCNWNRLSFSRLYDFQHNIAT